MRADKFLPIADLDEGFIRPTYEDQVIVSYMQAGLVCQFIDHQYGVEKLRMMLSSFKNGMDTRDSVEAATELSAEEFDREFAEFIQDSLRIFNQVISELSINGKGPVAADFRTIYLYYETDDGITVLDYYANYTR